jgi:thiol-disulfide isomerase/thioredoxin
MKTNLNKNLRSAVLLLAFMLLASCDQQEHTAQQTIDFNALQGQWLVINYWASWCKPCIEEIPQLNSFAIQYREQVKVFGVNFDGVSGEKLESEVAQLAIEFPTLELDPAEQLGYPRPSVLPSTILINPQGELHRILVGPQTVDSLTQAMQP